MTSKERLEEILLKETGVCNDSTAEAILKKFVERRDLVHKKKLKEGYNPPPDEETPPPPPPPPPTPLSGIVRRSDEA